MHVEKSILYKLIVARCINTALIIYLITPHDEQFSNDNLGKIQNVLLADAIATPFFRLCNLPDIFKRYVIGYFSSTQDELNTYWQGAEWTLAERYTDVLKSVFIGLFYAVPLPSGLFITSFTMITTYFVDKYSLYRLWIRKPAINGELSAFCRHFFGFTLWVHIAISMRFYANWPYGGLWGEDKIAQPVCSMWKCDGLRY
jgi:hypothetical protein